MHRPKPRAQMQGLQIFMNMTENSAVNSLQTQSKESLFNSI